MADKGETHSEKFFRVIQGLEFGGLNLVEAASQTHFIVPPHQHEATHVTLMLEGNCADTYRNRARTLTPLTALYFHPGESHGLQVGQQPIRTFDIEVTPGWFRQHEALAASPMAVLESSRYATGWLMTRLYREFKEGDDLSPLAIEGLLLEIFADLVRAAKSGKVKSAPFWLHRVKELIADEFARLAVERTRGMKTGNGLLPGIDMGPAVDQQQFNTDWHYIEIGKKEAKLLIGGEPLRGTAHDTDYARGYYVPPTIFDHVEPNSVIAQDEIFGPVLSIVRVKDFDEAMAVANSVRYGLSSSIYSNDSAKIFEFIDKIETGGGR